MAHEVCAVSLTRIEIRRARMLLSLSPSSLAAKVRSVTTATVKRAESDEPGPPLADSHLKAIQQTLEALGVEFTPEGPRLRERSK